MEEWGINGRHIKTGTKYDEEGFDRYGWNSEGYNREGYDKEGYDREGYNRDGFNIDGIHKETKGKYDENGYNKAGYDKKGYDKEGFNRYGWNREHYDREGYDKEGYNKEGYNRDGYDFFGYDRDGYNKKGFDRKGYDREGYDKKGYDIDGFNKKGYNKEGYDKEGYDKEGFNVEGINREGRNREEEKECQEHQRRKNYLGLINKAKKLASGELSVEEYVAKSKASIDQLIEIAKKEHLGSDVIKELNKKRTLYKAYTTPFHKKNYLETTSYMIEGKIVKPTEEDVDKCIKYLKMNGRVLCNKTISETILQHLKGEIDVTIQKEETELESLEEEQQQLNSGIEKVQERKREILNKSNVQSIGG